MYDVLSNLIDPAAPVNWAHPLNRGRIAWWVALPNAGRRGNTWRNLTRRGTLDATLNNGPTWRAPTRPGGWGALLFDGSDDYLDVTASTAIEGLSSFTYAAWIRPTSFSLYANLLRTYPASPFSGVNVYLNITTGIPGFNFGNLNDRTGNTGLTLSAWNRLVVVVDAGALRFYLNGKLDATVGSGPGTVSGTTGWRMGLHVGDNEPYAGSLDDVTIVSRAWSSSLVAADYSLSRRGYPDVLNRLPAVRAYSYPSSTAGASGRRLRIDDGVRIGRDATIGGGVTLL